MTGPGLRFRARLRHPRPRVFLWAAGVCLWAALVGAGPARAGETAVIKVPKLNLRAAPSQKSTALAVLEKGMRLPVVRRLEDWIEVAYNDRRGFLRHRKRYLVIVAGDKSPSAKAAPAPDVEKIRRQAEAIQERIRASEAEVVTYTRQETAMVDSLDALDRGLNRTRAEIAATRGELEHLDKQIADADTAIAAMGRKMRSLEAYAARRLVALYKLNWLGRINILASAESMGELFHRERALERILAHDDRVLADLLRSRKQLAALRDRQSARRKAKVALEAELKDRMAQMAQDRTRRGRLLGEIRDRKSLELASIDSLKQAADRLDRKIRDLGRRLAEEAAQKAAKTAARPAAGSDSAGPASESEMAFTALKGLLNLPVNGKVISFFGPYRNPRFNVMNFQSGVDIEADLGEPVHAVCGGKILYSSWFKGYGNMLIVDHGGNYYTVYAHVEEMFKTKGAQVEAGEVIATVGDTGSLGGPKLHFEIRYHGKPLDPMEWIKKG